MEELKQNKPKVSSCAEPGGLREAKTIETRCHINHGSLKHRIYTCTCIYKLQNILRRTVSWKLSLHTHEQVIDGVVVRVGVLGGSVC